MKAICEEKKIGILTSAGPAALAATSHGGGAVAVPDSSKGLLLEGGVIAVDHDELQVDELEIESANDPAVMDEDMQFMWALQQSKRDHRGAEARDEDLVREAVMRSINGDVCDPFAAAVKASEMAYQEEQDPLAAATAAWAWL